MKVKIYPQPKKPIKISDVIFVLKEIIKMIKKDKKEEISGFHINIVENREVDFDIYFKIKKE